MDARYHHGCCLECGGTMSIHIDVGKPLGHTFKKRNPCNCYVSKLSTHQQFGFRYDAHDTYCPVYSVSRQ